MCAALGRDRLAVVPPLGGGEGPGPLALGSVREGSVDRGPWQRGRRYLGRGFAGQPAYSFAASHTAHQADVESPAKFEVFPYCPTSIRSIVAELVRSLGHKCFLPSTNNEERNEDETKARLPLKF